MECVKFVVVAQREHEKAIMYIEKGHKSRSRLGSDRHSSHLVKHKVVVKSDIIRDKRTGLLTTAVLPLIKIWSLEFMVGKARASGRGSGK